jgi:peroxiredoxin
VGDSLPNVVLPNHDGTQINLQDMLKDSNLVISFYRGAWCPYCNLEMKALIDHNEQFKAAGGELVAISPELPDNSMALIEKENIQFPVMSDVANKVSDTFGLIFKLPEDLQHLYKDFGFSLTEKNGDDSWALPMPATYVVNQQGKIVYAFVNADYTQRAEPADILTALKAI